MKRKDGEEYMENVVKTMWNITAKNNRNDAWGDAGGSFALLAGSPMPARLERTGKKQRTAQPSGSTTKVVARELANPGQIRATNIRSYQKNLHSVFRILRSGLEVEPQIFGVARLAKRDRRRIVPIGKRFVRRTSSDLPADYNDRLFDEIHRRTQGPDESIAMFATVMDNMFDRVTVKVPEATRLKIILPILPKPTGVLRSADASEGSFFVEELHLQSFRRPAREGHIGKVLGTAANPIILFVRAPKPGRSFVTDVVLLIAPWPRAVSARETGHGGNYVLSHLHGDERPYLKVKIMGTPILGLLDSGAMRTVVGGVGWRKLQNLDLPLQSSVVDYTVADGRVCRNMGSVQTPFDLLGKIRVIEIHIVPDLTEGRLVVFLRLGPDFKSCTSERRLRIAQPVISNLGTKIRVGIVDPDPGATTASAYRESEKRYETSSDVRPIKQRYYPVSPAKQKIIEAEVEEINNMENPLEGCKLIKMSSIKWKRSLQKILIPQHQKSTLIETVFGLQSLPTCPFCKGTHPAWSMSCPKFKEFEMSEDTPVLPTTPGVEGVNEPAEPPISAKETNAFVTKILYDLFPLQRPKIHELIELTATANLFPLGIAAPRLVLSEHGLPMANTPTPSPAALNGAPTAPPQYATNVATVNVAGLNRKKHALENFIETDLIKIVAITEIHNTPCFAELLEEVHQVPQNPNFEDVFFQRLTNNVNAFKNTPIIEPLSHSLNDEHMTDEITTDEVKSIISHLKNSKAPGPDEIRPILLNQTAPKSEDQSGVSMGSQAMDQSGFGLSVGPPLSQTINQGTNQGSLVSHFNSLEQKALLRTEQKKENSSRGTDALGPQLQGSGEESPPSRTTDAGGKNRRNWPTKDRYEETGLITRRPGSGRKRITIQRDDRFLVSTSLPNRTASAVFLVFILNGSLTGHRYITEVLEDHVMPFMITMALSPDMNPIEHVWDELGRRVRRHTPALRTAQELRELLLQEWNNIDQHVILNLIQNKELLELIEARISDIEGLSDDNDEGWESDDGPVDDIHGEEEFDEKEVSSLQEHPGGFSQEPSEELQLSSQYYLDPAASDTSELLLFFDQLFDSVNGSQFKSQDGKTLRSAVTDATNHIPFWESSIVTLKSMYFTAPGSTKPSFIYLWRKVRSIGFKFLTPRALNQDLLENFFSCVRGYAGANSKPTPTSLAHTTKALLMNNLVSPRAIGANCEDDGSLSYLDNLKTFLNTEVAITETPLVLAPVYPPEENCPGEIVPDKSTSTTLRNTLLTYKHDSAGSFSITGNQLNRVYVRARDYAKLYWSTCPVLFRPDTDYWRPAYDPSSVPCLGLPRNRLAAGAPSTVGLCSLVRAWAISGGIASDISHPSCEGVQAILGRGVGPASGYPSLDRCGRCRDLRSPSTKCMIVRAMLVFYADMVGSVSAAGTYWASLGGLTAPPDPLVVVVTMTLFDPFDPLTHCVPPSEDIQWLLLGGPSAGDGPGGTGCGHLRTANLPTVGIPSNPVELRRCSNAVETVCHILQACPVAHDSRIHRHKAVATKIAVQCRKDGREVLEEPHIRHPDGTLYKPDLIVFRSPTDAIVCDVQVSWEVGLSSAEVWRRKRDVYGNPKFLEAARRRWPGTTFEFLPLIVGARGVWPSCNAPTSQALRIHAGLRRSCVAAVLKWGCSAHRSFMKRVWKDGATRRFRMVDHVEAEVRTPQRAEKRPENSKSSSAVSLGKLKSTRAGKRRKEQVTGNGTDGNATERRGVELTVGHCNSGTAPPHGRARNRLQLTALTVTPPNDEGINQRARNQGQGTTLTATPPDRTNPQKEEKENGAEENGQPHRKRAVCPTLEIEKELGTIANAIKKEQAGKISFTKEEQKRILEASGTIRSSVMQLLESLKLPPEQEPWGLIRWQFVSSFMDREESWRARLPQALTGHGCFPAFLHTIGKQQDDCCCYCGERDGAEHTLFVCEDPERLGMRSRVLTEKDKREREREVGGGSPLNVNDQDQAPEWVVVAVNHEHTDMNIFAEHLEPELLGQLVEFGEKDQVTIEKALLIAIWTLATPDCYRSIGVMLHQVQDSAVAIFVTAFEPHHLTPEKKKENIFKIKKVVNIRMRLAQVHKV
ncbi:hypothetical protein GEV33_009431 [Tenebrio molitor]|uniref:Uncharacterized protein n=1 Tax=Tenebrio molitor TaxID=7067 RepID=A0A8J6HET3_TENMO|nr:hypothetical protein GEV33_009431 [Tenebrio molitor]